MATPPDNHQVPLKYQTWTLKVPIHCEGCKKKVRKILQSMDGVYMTTIDSQQHKVIVTGNIEAETLLKKLSKSGKTAQLWPDSKPKEIIIQESPPNMEQNIDNPNPKPNDEQINQNPENTPTNPTPPPTEGGNNQDAQSKKKKKKKKVNNNNNNPSTDSDNIPPGEAPPPPPQPPQPPQPQPTSPPESTPPPPLPPPQQQEEAETGAKEEIPIESLNLGPPDEPGPLPMYHHPYFRPPVNNPGYINIPAPPPPPPMGVSYSMAQPSTSGSHYAPPVYPYYAYPHHPMMHNVPLPPPPRRINDYYDDHDLYNTPDYNNDASSQCRLM